MRNNLWHNNIIITILLVIKLCCDSWTVDGRLRGNFVEDSLVGQIQNGRQLFDRSFDICSIIGVCDNFVGERIIVDLVKG